MSIMSKRAPSDTGSIRISILFKCLVILSAATFSVATVLTLMADRIVTDVSRSGMEFLARDVTELKAIELEGAVRFGKTDIVLGKIQELLDSHSTKISAIVVLNAATEVMARVGASEGTQLITLAETSKLTAALETTGDGLWVAVPIGVSGEGTAAGALAIAWSDVAAMAVLREARMRSLTIGAGVFFVILIAAGVFFRFSLAAPLSRVAQRTAEMTQGDLTSEIKGQKRRDEIGLLSREMDALRAQLHEAEKVTQDALFKSAGFQGSSTALTMTDTDFVLTHSNAAFGTFLDNSAKVMLKTPSDRAPDLLGHPLNTTMNDNGAIASMVAQGSFPVLRDLRLGDQIIALKINQVTNDADATIGYIFEWEDITVAGTNKAVIAALEADQIRADFDENGHLKSVNAQMGERFPTLLAPPANIALDGLVQPTSPGISLEDAGAGKAVFDKLKISHAGVERIVSGSITPILDRDGRITGYVLLGKDITDAEFAKNEALEIAAALEDAQRRVVDNLSAALTALSQGDLSVRLDTPFTESYETLRSHFNESVHALDDALSLVLDNSGAILGEAGNISTAADDLSRRTEQQAATLEEFAAALTEITASVASAAEGANKASNVVTDARKNAEASGSVVREAVDAMGEIANSSEQISRIISVIDDIAFQTNLLALNAGVEAARAGDAGRGFAVVASEVRALAQRSSEAAPEINTLISTSGNQVKRGVSLVDKAGDALNEIVTSVGDIEEHVTGIAASAREQSTGLEEINTAISQLDQVTQQNVAMFEETTAATHTLTAEANALVTTTARFRTTSNNTAPARASGTDRKRAEPMPSPSGSQNRDSTAFKPKNVPSRPSNIGVTDGALAVADEDDWEDF